MSTYKEYRELWSKLPKDVQANIEFSKLVREEDWSELETAIKYNLNYFLGEYSLEILKWVVITVFSGKNKGLSGDKFHAKMCEIYTDYFFFVSNPMNAEGRRAWKQLALYSGRDNAKLSTWIKTNAIRWFTKRKMKHDKELSLFVSLIEYMDYESILNHDVTDSELSDIEVENRKRLDAAYESLDERDKATIKVTVVDEEHWTVAFDKLEKYIKDTADSEDISNWSNKKKQDTIARLKGRAIKKLIANFNK